MHKAVFTHRTGPITARKAMCTQGSATFLSVCYDRIVRSTQWKLYRSVGKCRLRLVNRYNVDGNWAPARPELAQGTFCLRAGVRLPGERLHLPHARLSLPSEKLRLSRTSTNNLFVVDGKLSRSLGTQRRTCGKPSSALGNKCSARG